MRHNNSNRRSRKRGNSGGHNHGGNRGGNSRTKVYDSNGPDVRIRGTAHQVAEKYEALAKDALAGGNIVLAEGYHQHAEHYRRIIGEVTENAQAKSASNADGNRADSKAQSGNNNAASDNTSNKPKAQSKSRTNGRAGNRAGGRTRTENNAETATKDGAEPLPGMSDDLSLPASLLGGDVDVAPTDSLESA